MNAPRLALALAVLLLTTGCARDLTELDPATFPADAEVFINGFAAGVDFQAFSGSDPGAVAIDQSVFRSGGSALRIDVPAPSNPAGSYAGGAFTSNTPRDLTGYTALTFWARASRPAALDVAGLGNDNTGTSLYTAQVGALPLTTEWQQYAVPIPDPSKLDREGGLFFFAEGAEGGNPYSFWIDDLQFQDLSTVGSPRPAMAEKTIRGEVGTVGTVSGTTVTFDVSGQDVTVAAAPAYFEYTSSDEAVATVSEVGEIAIVGEGTATVTASLDGAQAAGTVTVTTETLAVPPSEPAPTPAQNASSVISIYSDAYDDVPNSGFANYGAAAFTEVDVAGSGNRALRYTFADVGGGNFQVIELGGNQIDAAAAGMTNFRFDLYFPNEIEANTEFLLKLVNITGSGATEAQLRINAGSTPPIEQGRWLSFDYALEDLTALGGISNLQQVVVDLLTAGEVYIDNIYFYAAGGGGPIPPSQPAPTPQQAAANVISIYSNAYESVANSGFANYGAAAFAEVDVADSGNTALRYTFVEGGGGNFQVIELGGNQIDAATAGMTNFRFDLYFPNPVEASTEFLLKLVNIPGSGATEAQLRINGSSTPPIQQGTWLSFDYVLSELTALGGTGNLQQVVVDLLTSGEVYIDNIYFYR